jgi:hypothetical protein
MRFDIHELLLTRAPPLAALYQAATRMLDDPSFPARDTLIPHCVREIANSLPQHLGEPTTGRVEYAALIGPLIEPWRDAGLPFGHDPPPMAIEDQAAGALSSVPVPYHLVSQLGELFRAHAAGTARHRDNAEIIFRAFIADGDADAAHLRPVVAEWMNVCKWFQRKVHHDRRPNAAGDDSANQELLEAFERFEQLLHAMVQPFLDIAKSLDEDLAKANA